jgi:hypothetical protein
MRYQLEISSRALPGREADYDTWYDNIHVKEVLALPGFLSCQRYTRSAAGSPSDGECVSLYEVETDDPQALLQSLFAAAPSMQLTDSIDMQSARFEFLKPHGGLHRAPN